jgi:hypothetical protein
MSVSSGGLVTATGAGTATISVVIDNVTGGSSIKVRLAVPFTFTETGLVLGPTDIGQPPGDLTGTADVSAVELPDKRIRLYFSTFLGSAGPGPMMTAISNDGVHFTVEGSPKEAGTSKIYSGGQPLIFPLTGGGFRLFSNRCFGACDEQSATSQDGLNFAPEAGSRFPTAIIGTDPACAGLIKLSDGRFRIYCSGAASSHTVGNATIKVHAVYSATSTDLLTWTLDPGFRVGPGAPTLMLDADHPTAIVTADGTVALIYYQRVDNRPDPHEMIALSKDGLTFDTEYDSGLVGTEPSIMKRADGTLLLYHGGQTPATGSTIAVAQVTLK